LRSAITDSEAKIYFDETNKPGISNLLTIYASLTDLSIDSIVDKYKDETSYANFKLDLAEIVANHIEPIQKRFNELVNSNELDTILDDGAKHASLIAGRKMNRVLNRLGLQRKK